MSGKHFIDRDPYGLCQRCQTKFRLSQLKQEWTGLLTCSGPGTRSCWEPRHGNDFVFMPKEDIAVERPSPRRAEIYVDTSLPPDLSKL